MAQPSSTEVRHEAAEHRFVIPIEGDAVGAAYYIEDPQGRLVLTHAEVPSEYMGRGIATALAQGVFDEARASGLKLVLRCPFMVAWYARHPEYSDVVDG